MKRFLFIAAAAIVANHPAGSAQTASQIHTTAFVGARVIDGTDRRPIDNATIVVRDGRVVAVGNGLAVPADATRVSLAGKTVIPGLVNAHGHVGNTVGMQQGQYSRENVLRDLQT